EVNFYSLLNSLNPEQEAERFFVKAKHQLEKAAALNCDVFSTVSEITALEAEKFLERAPDITLPNGLEEDKLFSFEELAERHRLQRTRLREFLIAFFFPYYNFNLENTLFYFLASRYEIKAKGIDVFIKSLSQLNKKLKAQKSEKTVVAFLLVPSSVKGVSQEVFENKQYFYDLRDSLEDISEETEEKILFSLAEGKEFSQKVLFSQNFLLSLRKKLLQLKRKGLPPLVTHELENENDSILQLLKAEGLLNKKEDKVKVIFYPDYLNGHDGLSDLNYEEMLQACHFGVFPSFYEPWGYTPLETAGFGVASLTTDLAGFGRFCLGLERDKKYPGIFVLQRDKREEKEIIKDLTEILFNFSQYSKKERVESKIQARKIAALTDWKILAKKYIEAHNLCFLK
ncbi:MAG: hypothetical protein Q8N55_00575, partial [bacterium]|nr:hypothetical protein [bacterium]